MRLGNFAELSIGVIELGPTLLFYERLGFEKLDQNLEPWPWAVLTDGVITLTLSQASSPSLPVLNYFASDMDSRIETLRKSGVEIVNLHDDEITEVRGGVAAPDGIDISLLQHAAKSIPQPPGESCVKCGVFGELAFPVKDLSRSVEFWRDVGFETERTSRLPYPWAVLTDGLFTLGFYETSDLSGAALVYYSDNVQDRVEQLAAEGFSLERALPSPDMGIGRVGIHPPDGQVRILLDYRS